MGLAPYAQSNYARPGYDDQPSGAADGLAIASLVFGVLSLPLFCAWCLAIPAGVVALALGAFGLNGRNRSLAIAGMICGGLGILISVIFLVVIFSMRGSSPPGSNPFR